MFNANLQMSNKLFVKPIACLQHFWSLYFILKYNNDDISCWKNDWDVVEKFVNNVYRYKSILNTYVFVWVSKNAFPLHCNDKSWHIFDMTYITSVCDGWNYSVWRLVQYVTKDYRHLRMQPALSNSVMHQCSI